MSGWRGTPIATVFMRIMRGRSRRGLAGRLNLNVAVSVRRYRALFMDA